MLWQWTFSIKIATNAISRFLLVMLTLTETDLNFYFGCDSELKQTTFCLTAFSIIALANTEANNQTLERVLEGSEVEGLACKVG
jgi:hypothetical protein